MPLLAPDWLKLHGGTVRPGIDGRSWFVFFAEQLQYELTPIPVQGKYGCEVRQTNNGKRHDSGSVYPGADEALRAGLIDLRQALGW